MKAKRKYPKLIWIVLIATFCLIAISFVCANIYVKQNNYFAGLININLADTSLSEINNGSKKEVYKGNEVEIYNNRQDCIQTFESVEIKGRGNSTWGHPKKPYQIKFSDEIDLFNLGASKNWVLLANYRDSSQIKNSLSFYIGRMLNISNTWDGVFVNLSFNGKYTGLYWLTHKVEIGSFCDEITEDSVIVEKDERETDKLFAYSEINKTTFFVADSNFDEQVSLDMFIKAYNKFEWALYNKDWEGIKKYSDIESFAKYFIVSTVTKSSEAYTVGMHFYVKGNDEVVCCGPIWDFDSAYGVFKTGEINKSAKSTWLYIENTSKIFDKLLAIPEFFDLAKKEYISNISSNKDKIYSYISNARRQLFFVNVLDNFQWYAKPYQYGDIDYLETWIKIRLDYLDIIFNGINYINNGRYSIKTLDGQSLGTYHINVENNEYYTITNKSSGKMFSSLDFNKNDENQQVNFGLVNEYKDYNQNWFFVKAENGFYIANLLTGFVLTYNNGWSLQELNNQNEQLFIIEPVKEQNE